MMSAAREALVGSGRGVARQPLALCIAIAARREKAVKGRDAVDAGLECSISRDLHIARLEPGLRHERERDVDPVGRQPIRGAVRPFDDKHRAVGQVV